ncbi:MAG: hypothetical protein KKF21_19755, partial [Bacteroidetes bacterium]|nr:hypothetical protein [Bacteroidota bacterium]
MSLGRRAARAAGAGVIGGAAGVGLVHLGAKGLSKYMLKGKGASTMTEGQITAARLLSLGILGTSAGVGTLGGQSLIGKGTPPPGAVKAAA